MFYFLVGYKVAHGYYLYKSPQTSTQLTPGEYLNTNYEDGTRALREGNSVSLQNQPDFINKRAMFSVPHNDNRKNKVWIKQGNGHQMPNRHQPWHNLGGSTDVRVNKGFSHQPALHPYKRFPASEPALLSGRNDIFSSVSKSKHPQTAKKPTQKPFPSRSLLDDPFTGKTGPPADASNRPSQDFVSFSPKSSRQISLPSKKNVKKPKFVYQTSYKTPLISFDNGKGLHKDTKAISFRNPPSLNYFVPENQIYVPKYEIKRRKKAAKSLLPSQSRTGKKMNSNYYNPAVQKSGSVEFVSDLNSLLPLKGKKKNFRANVLYKPQKVLDKSNRVFNVKPSSRGSNRPSTSLGYQKFDVDPFKPTTHSEKAGKSHLYHQNLDSALQNVNTKYSSKESPKKGIPPRGAQNQMNSVSAQDRFLLLNGGYEDARKAGLLKTFNQPDDLNMFSASLKKEPTNLASWPEPMGSDFNCVVWKNEQRSPLQRSQKSSRPSVKSYIKSGNRSGRATSFLSKTCYFQHQQVQDKADNRQQNAATRWRA